MPLLPLATQRVLLERVRNDVTVPGLSSEVDWGEVVSQGVTLLGACINGWRVRERLKEIEPDIRRLLPLKGGVLVLIGYCNTEAATALEGQRVYLSADAVLGGATLSETLFRWQSMTANGTICASCPDGWSRSEEILWVTQAGRATSR